MHWWQSITISHSFRPAGVTAEGPAAIVVYLDIRAGLVLVMEWGTGIVVWCTLTLGGLVLVG